MDQVIFPIDAFCSMKLGSHFIRQRQSLLLLLQHHAQALRSGPRRPAFGSAARQLARTHQTTSSSGRLRRGRARHAHVLTRVFQKRHGRLPSQRPRRANQPTAKERCADADSNGRLTTVCPLSTNVRATCRLPAEDLRQER